MFCGFPTRVSFELFEIILTVIFLNTKFMSIIFINILLKTVLMQFHALFTDNIPKE